MSLAAAIEVRGWCPGALRPMPSGDGLIVRVRPWCGALGLDQMHGLADTAERFGNGHIDLTRRANLQIRGVRDEGVADLQATLGTLGLLDRDPRVEAGRNIMVGPLAGIDPAEPFDVRPIARTLVDLLAADDRLQGLPSKFGFIVDGGGTVSIAGERADISLRAVGSTMAVAIGVEWLGTVAPDEAASLAVTAAAACRQRVRDLAAQCIADLRASLMPILRPLDIEVPPATSRVLGLLSLGSGKVAVGVAAPFGRLEAGQLRGFIAAAAKGGAGDLRLSPWRALYAEVRDEEAAAALVEAAREIGLVADSGDPILRIDACPGTPACGSSSVDTRNLAALLARKVFHGAVHISGCAKGCARSEPAETVLVGEQGRYNLIRNGTARDVPARTVTREEAGALFDG